MRILAISPQMPGRSAEMDEEAASTALGEAIVADIDALAAISEQPGAITRVFLSPQHRVAADFLIERMRAAGMSAHMDAIGNVCGRYEGATPKQPCLMLGSHYDTVRDAGRWDGPLGVITAIACVAALHRHGKRLPFAIEVVAFADEEGTRFNSTLLGSRAVAGTLNESVFGARDANGIAMRDAMTAFGLDPAQIGAAARHSGDVAAYVELHIEQGPVLEDEDVPVGVVTAISGATRLACVITGMAGHAGTVPMTLRRDALAGAAECIGAIETFCAADKMLVGTVGSINALPGATNVIPGKVTFTIDVRSAADTTRKRAVADIVRLIEAIAKRRNLALQIDVTHENRTTPCASWLQDQLAAAIARHRLPVRHLPSGAGHDGMAMIDLTDITMLFVRCRGGISHHPDEHVSTADAGIAAQVLLSFIENFSPQKF